MGNKDGRSDEWRSSRCQTRFHDAEVVVRIGGHVVVETLKALRARTVFSIPGQHALGAFHARSGAPLTYIGCRTECNAAFAADGRARITGQVTPLIVSTGPGALQTLAGLQEPAAASAPVLGISRQIPRAGSQEGVLDRL